MHLLKTYQMAENWEAKKASPASKWALTPEYPWWEHSLVAATIFNLHICPLEVQQVQVPWGVTCFILWPERRIVFHKNKL